MPETVALTAAAELLRRRRPNQGERYAIATLLEECAAEPKSDGLEQENAKPKKRGRKPKSLDEAIDAAESDDASEDG